MNLKRFVGWSLKAWIDILTCCDVEGEGVWINGRGRKGEEEENNTIGGHVKRSFSHIPHCAILQLYCTTS